MGNCVKEDSMSDKDELHVYEASVYIEKEKLFRKVDLHILPLMVVTYGLQFMDKLALGQSSVFGLKKDLGLVGQDYSWTSSIFYFGYMLGNLVSVRVLQIVPIAKFVSVSVCLWGITLACSGACQNYAGILAARFFLGLLESVVSPSFMLITGMWWKPEQQSARSGIWFAGNDAGAIVGSFLSFGLGHITGKLSPWRYIFIVYGCITFVWSFALFFFLPDSPSKASFLTEAEKQFYAENMKNQKVENDWSWDELFSCAKDINLWLLLGSVVLSILPNSGVQSYGNIILHKLRIQRHKYDVTQFAGLCDCLDGYHRIWSHCQQKERAQMCDDFCVLHVWNHRRMSHLQGSKSGSQIDWILFCLSPDRNVPIVAVDGLVQFRWLDKKDYCQQFYVPDLLRQ
ncbi:hypothetical protein KL929_004505 [Ogataea haglerorum]|nr:hypothetical protein KL929_004505 [Ogataea haglerorum]